jgi:hypothetical protein
MDHQTTDPDSMVGGVVVADSDNSASPTRRPTRTQGRKLSTRDLRRPGAMARSRRSGLTRELCSFCLAVRGPEGHTEHSRTCTAAVSTDAGLPERLQPVGRWMRQITGPITSRQTSLDTGWEYRVD